MTFFCIILWCRDIWLQMEADQQIPSVPVIACEPWRRVCIPIYGSVSVSFSAEFNFTAPFFDLYLYISAYKENKEVMDSDKEIYSVFKFTLLCHIILPLLAVLQRCQWKGSCLSGVLQNVKLQRHKPCCVGLQPWAIYQECIY